MGEIDGPFWQSSSITNASVDKKKPTFYIAAIAGEMGPVPTAKLGGKFQNFMQGKKVKVFFEKYFLYIKKKIYIRVFSI